MPLPRLVQIDKVINKNKKETKSIFQEVFTAVKHMTEMISQYFYCIFLFIVWIFGHAVFSKRMPCIFKRDKMDANYKSAGIAMIDSVS